VSTYPIRELEQKVHILTRLAEISTVINSTLQLEPLLAMIMDTAAQIVDAEAASVLLWDHKNQELRFTATTTEVGQGLIGMLVPLEGSIAGAVMLENCIVSVDNAVSDPRHYSKADKESGFHTRSVLGVPMRSKNRVIGVLEAVNKRQGPWLEDDSRYLSILAAQAAVAIEGAQLVSQLQAANEELSQLDKLKSDFIAIASHELRTPLGVILGYASFLQEDNDPNVRSQATEMVSAALHLRRIIEDLTNLRYMEEKSSDLHREPVPLGDLLREVTQEIRPLAEAKGHQLLMTSPVPDIDIYVDRIRMEMVLSNVLNNAVRFTPQQGRIHVETEVRKPREAWVTITDNGIGLREEHLERIFERFYQVEDHMTRSNGGLGIGLSIARALVEAHGGRIWASSSGLSQGATFTIAIPLSHL
jgi:signal transduction histidine kinase